MRPAILDGDILFLCSSAEGLVPGDITCVHDSHRDFVQCHRVVKVDQSGERFWMRGDSARQLREVDLTNQDVKILKVHGYSRDGQQAITLSQWGNAYYLWRSRVMTILRTWKGWLCGS